MSRAEAAYHPMRPRPRPQRKVRRRFLKRIFKTVFGLGCLAFLLYAFGGFLIESPRFSLQEVHISGLEALSEEEVVNAAGLNTALNTFMLDPEVIEQHVAALPCVASCTVRREFPRKLFLDVTERKPFANLQYANTTFELDRDGRVLREVEPLAPLTLPILSSEELEAMPTPGDQLNLPGLTNALKLVEVYYSTPVQQRMKLSEIVAQGQNTLLMFVDEYSFEIRWGRSDFYEQAQRLDTLLAANNGALPCSEYLDLRFDSDVICR